MGVTPTAPMGPLGNVSTSNLAYNIPNYLCNNFGAFIKKCTIDQLIRSTICRFAAVEVALIVSCKSMRNHFNRSAVTSKEDELPKAENKAGD